MTTHGSATTREQAPHVNQTTRTATILEALKRRAQARLNDKSLDPQSRAILRYALETHDPWLAELVRRAEAGETIGDDFSHTPDINDDDVSSKHSSSEHVASEHVSSQQKIEALAEMICRGSDESPAALLVLMGMLENSTDPKVLANSAKHYAFTRCGELNLFGMVEAQIAMAEGELLAGITTLS